MMEGFVSQFPAIAIGLLSIALGALAWYLRADRERLFDEIEHLGSTIQALRQEVHEAMMDHGERISRLEGLVSYHLKHNGRAEA